MQYENKWGGDCAICAIVSVSFIVSYRSTDSALWNVVPNDIYKMKLNAQNVYAGCENRTLNSCFMNKMNEFYVLCDINL